MKNASAPLPRLFTIAELAQRLSVSTKTIHRWIAAGDLRTHKLGRQVRIAEEDAVSFVSRGRR